MSTTLTVTLPDESNLAILDADKMLALKVVDSATCELAGKYKNMADKFVKEVKALCAESKASADKAHKDTCALEKRLLGKAPEVVAYLKKEADTWVRAEEKKQQDFKERLLAAADAFREPEEERLPWEEPPPISAMVVAPPVIVLPKIETPGFEKKWKPWDYRLKGPDQNESLMLLLTAIVERRIALDDGFGTPSLLLNPTFFKNAVRQLEAGLEERFPGVEGFRETRLS